MRIFFAIYLCILVACTTREAAQVSIDGTLHEPASDSATKAFSGPASPVINAQSKDAISAFPKMRPTRVLGKPAANKPSSPAILTEPTGASAMRFRQALRQTQDRGRRYLTARLKVPTLKEATSKAWFEAAQLSGAEAMRKRRPQWRVEHSLEWVTLMSKLKAHLGQLSSNDQELRRAHQAILDVAMKCMSSSHSFDRSAGYLLARFIWVRAHHLKHGFKASEPSIDAMVSQYSLERPPEERRVLLKSLVGHVMPDHRSFLAWIAIIDPDKEARVEALKGLSSCAKSTPKCQAEADTIRLIYDRHNDHLTRNALYVYAGLSQYSPVLKWCSVPVYSGPNSVACRTALSHYGKKESFDILVKWIEKQMHQPDTLLPGSYDFRDDFRYLLPYGNFDFSSDKYFKLLESVLLQTERSGYATGVIVKTLKYLKDRARVRPLLAKVTAVYRRNLGDRPKVPADAFMMASLRQAAADLAGKYPVSD